MSDLFKSEKLRKLRLICCEVLFREACHYMASCPNRIDPLFVEKGLHDMKSSDMLSRLQAMVDASSGKGYEAILMGYALCNNGLSGLTARDIPVAIPRAHDCITLLLGSRERYKKRFDAKPGFYYLSSGWLERGEANPSSEDSQLFIGQQLGMNKSYQQLVEEYGEDNAQYLYETLCQTTKNYSGVCFIETGLEPDASFETTARDAASSRKWDFDKEKGDLSLLRRLLAGEWDEKDFLVLKPGESLKPNYGESIVEARKANS